MFLVKKHSLTNQRLTLSSLLFSSTIFQCDPPIEVHDLFRDIQDGHILMALLEELSGCKLVRLSLFVLSAG